MQLWTDYEGVTIDGAFPLQKLLLPEGRSAFYSTANGRGEPVVLRLIECHFDEEEILARWRCVEALNHPNFLKLERYGQIELDGGPVVYAVFEKVDANLAGVLDDGHLSVKDTAQLAASLISALELLHTHGFIHEHVSPGSIFAVGDVVKLRSDCIREAPEGEAGLAAKRRDIHDLAVVLLQALALRKSLDGISESAVPPPFDKIVRNGMNGTWGPAEIRAALEGRQMPPPFSPATTASPVRFNPADYPPVSQTVVPSVTSTFSAAVAAAFAPPPVTTNKPVPPASKPNSTTKPEEPATWSQNIRSATRQELWDEERVGSSSLQSKWLGVGGLVAILFLISCWLLVHTWHTDHGHVAPATTSIKSSPAPASQSTAATRNRSLTRVNSLPPASQAGGSRTQWRVIAFTYNSKEDAQKKAAALAQNHPNLQPEVFSPSGHAPFLVAIGGVMSKDAAYTLAHRSRSIGLPRDTYAQNYSGAAH